MRWGVLSGMEWGGVGCFGLEVVWGGGGVDGRIDGGGFFEGWFVSWRGWRVLFLGVCASCKWG